MAFDFKDFLKPTIPKLALFILLFFLLGGLWKSNLEGNNAPRGLFSFHPQGDVIEKYHVYPYEYKGLPFVYYTRELCGFTAEGKSICSGGYGGYQYYTVYAALAVNAGFWYLVACIFAFAYSKLIKK
jgi:hypothetical protein